MSASAAQGEQQAVSSPANCRNRLMAEVKPYPRSGCDHCRTGGLTGCPYERKVHDLHPQPVAGDAVRVVPVEPDSRMLDAAFMAQPRFAVSDDIRSVWAAMVGAAPASTAAPAPAAGDAVPLFPYGSRAEWQDNLGRWWPVTITDWRSATYSARLDDGTDARNYPITRFRALAVAPQPPAATDAQGGAA